MAGEGQAPAIVQAAELLLGPPHKTSNPPKFYFGPDATTKVDAEAGTFFDYQTETGGNLFEMIRAYLPPGDETPAEAWLKANGIFTNAAGSVVELPEDEADERALLGFLLVNPKLMIVCEEEIGALDFANRLHGEMFMVFSDGAAHDYTVDMGQLIAAMGGDPKREVMPGFTLGQYVARLAAEAPIGGNGELPEVFARVLARKIARDADIERGDIEPEPEEAPLPPWPEKLGAVSWAEMHKPRPAYEYLVKQIIPRREMCVIYGERQSGKSFFAFDLAMSIARGLTYFGWRGKGHQVIRGLVIYCAVEAGTGFVDVRMPAYEQYHGLPKGERLPFVCMTRRFNLFKDDTDLTLLGNEIKAIVAHFPDFPLELVVIDTYNKATSGSDEVKGLDVSIIMDRLERIREFFKCAVWLVHHKNAQGGMRGHTSLGDNFETVIEISRNRDARDDDGREIRTATLRKQREGGDDVSWPFVLHKIEIRKDADGEPVTSCAVTPPASQFGQDAPTKTRDDGFNIRHPSTRQYYRCLVDAMKEFGGEVQPDMNVRCPKGTWVVHLEKWRELCLRKIASTTAAKDPGDTVRKGTAAAMTKFGEAGLIGSDMPWVWFTDKKVAGFPRMVFGSNVVDLTGTPINSGGQEPEFPDDELPLK